MNMKPQQDPRAPDVRLCRQAGFTLVEMLLVLVILATLAAVVVPKFAGRSQQAKETAARSQIASFEMALDAFEVDNGYYPAGANGLQELIDAPSGAPDWRGPYLKKPTIPLDPWANEYIYAYPGNENPDGYDLWSMGPDGREGGTDDITNWEDTRARR
jgi:general secretion pathway protein G